MNRLGIAGIALVGTLAAPAVAAPVAGARGARTVLSVRIVPDSRQSVLRSRALRVRVRGYGRVRLTAEVRTGNAAARRRRGAALTRSLTVDGGRNRTVNLRLRTGGLRALRTCGIARVVVEASARPGRRRASRTRRRASRTYPAVASGCHGGLIDVPGVARGTSFRVGAAVGDFTPPAFGQAPGGDPADCGPPGGIFSGPRAFAFIEPYVDTNGNGHYDPPDPTNGLPGEPFLDCNGNARWDGNLLGGGTDQPRFFDHVADPVGARALVVSNGQRTIAVEVTDQEGLFNVYADRIRQRVAADGVRLDGIYISATHDESAPDTLGINSNTGVSSVNAYFADFLVRRSAEAIEAAYRAQRPAYVRYAVAQEPGDMRQCWSSYPFVDDQRMPVLQAVGTDGATIATLANVSQHAETLGFNPPKTNPERAWISADWPHFLRAALERRYGGVGIEMAGSVGSVETPEIFGGAISRTPQRFVNESHPAGCRTLFDAPGTPLPVGYDTETRALGEQLAGAVQSALDHGAALSDSEDVWGASTPICVPLENALFAAAAPLGVFAARPGYSANCTVQGPVAPNGSTSGNEIRSDVAAFGIGDGEFATVPGEVFPFTYLRGFLGPQDLPVPGSDLPPWLMPHMRTPYRFIDGLGEDMIGYIFPRGNAVGIPTTSDPNPSGTDRFGCGHSDDGEAASAQAGDIAGHALAGLLDARHGAPERIAVGRYVLPDGTRSRDPLGGPVIKCDVDRTYRAVGPATAVDVRGAGIVRPHAWMALDGRPQHVPDRDTRGYIAGDGSRVWLDVFPD